MALVTCRRSLILGGLAALVAAPALVRRAALEALPRGAVMPSAPVLPGLVEVVAKWVGSPFLDLPLLAGWPSYDASGCPTRPHEVVGDGWLLDSEDVMVQHKINVLPVPGCSPVQVMRALWSTEVRFRTPFDLGISPGKEIRVNGDRFRVTEVREEKS